MAKWQNAPVVDTPRWAEAPLVERLQAAQARQKAATERLGSFPSLYDAPLTAEQQRRYDSDVDRMAQTGLTGLGQAEIVARQAYKTPDPQASIKREMDRRRYRGFLDELGVSLESGGETAVGGVLGTVGQGLRTLARNEVFWPLTRLAPLQRQASGIDIQGRDLDKWAQTIYEDTQRWQAQPGAGGGLAGFIANAAGRTVPYFAVATVAGIVGGPGATWAVTAAIEGDSAYRDAISQGATEEEAQLERIIVGSVNGVIEMAQVGEVLKMGQGASAVALKEFKDAVAERAWKKVAKATGKLSLNQLVMAVNEGAEEVAQEWVGAGAARIIHDQPMEDMGYRTGMAFAGGVVGGGLLGGGSLVIETALTQATEEAEEAGEAQGPPEIGTGGVGFTPRIQGGMTADEMVERLGGETVALEDLAGAVQRAAVDAETKAKLEELFGKKIEVRHEEASPAKEAAPAAAVPAEGAAPGVAEAPTVAERYKESITQLADSLLDLFEEAYGPPPVPEVQGEKSIYEEYLDDAEYLYGKADVWASVGMPQEEAIAEMLKEFDDLEDFPGDSVSREALAKQILTEVYDRAVGQSLLEEAAPVTPEAAPGEVTPAAKPAKLEEKPKAKEPFEMTRGEFREWATENHPNEAIRKAAKSKRSLEPGTAQAVDLSTVRADIVLQAFNRGEAIPPEVLKDYPDLQKRGKKPTEQAKKAKWVEIADELTASIQENGMSDRGGDYWTGRLKELSDADLKRFYDWTQRQGAKNPYIQRFAGGNASAEMRRREGLKSEPAAAKKPSEAERKIIKGLRESAEAMQAQIEAKRNPPIGQMAVTARRASIAGNIAAQADLMEQIQKAMRVLADAIENGTLPDSLKGVTKKTQVEDILTSRDYPYAYAHDAQQKDMLKAIEGTKGAPAVREALRGALRTGYGWRFTDAEQIAAEEQLVKMSRAKGEVSGKWVKDSLIRARRMLDAGITNEQQFQQAKKDLAELMGPKKTEPDTQRQIREKTAALIGVKIPGFFPTPKPVAEAMVEAADIQEGMTVLEPSAGKGDLADVIRDETGITPDVIETSSTLGDILKLKGYEPLQADFLEQTGEYDRIVINPPYEKGQDIDHVRHAYDMLKPGGRIVALMSEGVFSRGDSKATAFRQWLEEVGGTSEKIAAGAFTGKESFRQTGVAIRQVVIDKPTAEAPAAARAEEDTETTLRAELVTAEERQKANESNLAYAQMRQMPKEEIERRRELWTKEKRHIELLRTEIAKLQPKENLPTYERTTARGQTEELKKQMDLALASFRDYDAKYKQAKAGRDRCRQGSEQYKKRQAEMDAAEAKRSEWEKRYQDLEDRHNLAHMEDRYETAPTEIGKLAALHNLLLADRDKQDIVYARIQDIIEQMALDAGATEEQAKAARSEANSVITMPRSEFYTDKLEDFITVRIKGQQHREFINEAYTKFRAIEGLTESKPFEERMKKFTEQLRYDSPQQRAAATAELNTILAEAEAQAKEDRIVAEQQRQQEQERAAKRAIFWTQEAPTITKLWSPMVKPGSASENEIAANLQAVSKLLGRELTEPETGIIRTGSDMYAHRLQDAGDDYLLMVRESDTAFSKRLRDEAAQQLRRRYGVQVIQAEKSPKPTSPKSRDDVLKAIKPLSGAQDSRWAIAGFNVEPDGSVIVTDGRRLLVVDRWPLKEKIKAGLYRWTEKKKTDVRFGEPEGKFPKWIDIIPADADRTNSIPLDSPAQVAESIKATQKSAAFEYEEAAGAGVVLIRQKDGTTVVMNATMLREGLEALHKLGSVSAVVHTHGIDRPILVEGKDAKGQTLARLVQMPINRDATDWGAPANKSEFELGDVAPESKEAQPGPPLSALPEPEPSPLTQAIADKDFDTLKELLALGQDANRQRFEEITGIVLPDTEPGTENVIGEFVRGEADRYRRQSGRTTLIPDAAAELAAISRRLTGGPASLVSSAVRMFRRNIVSVNRYLRTMGGAGRLIAYDFDVITHAVTKQANNDKADLRKLFHGVSREQLRRAAMVVNERLDPKSQPKKVVDLANRMRQILDRSMNEANALGMTRKVRGKRIPIGGIGKAFPQVPNAKGVAFLKDAKVKGKGSSQVFAWAQEQVKAGRFQDVDEAITALQQFRDQQLRAVNRYFESSRVELPVDMIEWDPVKILPHLIDRNWMTIEGVRQWGVEKHGQSFPLLRSRIERIRRDYGSDAAQRIENYVQVAFGGRSPASKQAEDISRGVRGFQFITKVGISPITIIRNMADRLPKGMAISPLGTIRSAIDYPPFVNGFIEAAQKLEERMVRAGAVFGHGSLSEGYEAGSFFSELLGGPFSESERGNQVFIATVAYHKLMHDIAILERKGVDVTGRLLERVAAVFGQSRAQAAYRVGPDIEATILAGQEVSQEQIENFLAEAVSKNAFPMLLNTKPVWYETHPLMKVLAQFKTWPIRQTNLIYQDVLKYTVKTGDFTRLIGFLIGTLLAGEIYNLLRDWLFRKDESLLSQLRKDPESRRIGMAIFNDLIDGGGVGMVADFTYGIYDWAAGVTVRTASNVSDAVRNIRNAPGLTPQAVENLLTREVSPYRQLKGLYNRLDTAFNRDNMSKPYHMARAEAWRWKDAKEHPTAGSKIGAYADDVIWGKPDYGIGENTLAYELASRQIVAGDIGDAAKYLGYILSRAEDRKKALAGIRQSMNHRSPLGAIAERDRPAFLKSLSPETRTQIVNVQRNYLRSYNEALRQAQRNTR